MIRPLIDAAIRDHVIAGAVLVTGDDSGIRYAEAFGHAVPGRDIPMRLETVIDVASTSKVIATTTALCICRDRGWIDFDVDFRTFLPEFEPELAAPVTVRDLAMHVSGFGHEPGKARQYFDEDGRRIMRNMMTTPPLYAPRVQFEYCCWNFILLGMIVERVSGKSLSDFCRDEIFLPLGMTDTALGAPLTDDPQLLAQTLEADRPGAISDFVAKRVFGAGLCCGNAGVFSNGLDLAKFMRMILKHGKGVMSETSFREIAVCPEPGRYSADRTFGWVAADENRPAAASPRAIYHSGWSGQTIFADLDLNRFAVVLTARTGDYDRAKRERSELISMLIRL